jgi:iron complex transport system substrate-binding protein
MLVAVPPIHLRQDSPPVRVVSLLPSATEILYAIGAGDDVVAVTHECDFPPEAASRPAVTASALNHDGSACAVIDRHIKSALHAGSSIYRLDEKLLAALEPSLIVTQELCDVCAVSYDQVSKAVRRMSVDIPVLSLEPSSLVDILNSILAVGAVTDRANAAAQVVRSLRERIAAVDAQPAMPTPPRVACIEWTDPLMVAGHWVPEMVGRAGGSDTLGVAAQPSRWIEWEDIVASEPEVMVLMPCGFGLPATVALAPDVVGRPGFRDLPCARSGRVVAVDGSSYFNRPGPRIVDGLELLAAILRTRPSDPLPRGAAWIPI